MPNLHLNAIHYCPLQDIAKKRQLAIVDKDEDATHILHPVPEADDESYARAVFKRGEKCLVHFYRSDIMIDINSTLYLLQSRHRV